jgi:bifunctional N-acetylglucosamine-1-phosphate-uridyltransferase/glucosamine-1-phosphate-acetyltransferase GlmU-like protein
MDNNLAIIVLAAGQGTRMKSATPKILHPLAGAPIIAHVLATARALDAAHVVAVVRHERRPSFPARSSSTRTRSRARAARSSRRSRRSPPTSAARCSC